MQGCLRAPVGPGGRTCHRFMCRQTGVTYTTFDRRPYSVPPMNSPALPLSLPPWPDLPPSRSPSHPHRPPRSSLTPRWPLTHFGLILVPGIEVRVVSIEDYPVVVEEDVSHGEGRGRGRSWRSFGGNGGVVSAQRVWTRQPCRETSLVLFLRDRAEGDTGAWGGREGG